MYNYNAPYFNTYYGNINQNQYLTLPLTFVNGIDEARKYIVPLNTTVYLRDNNSDMLFIKHSDTQGKMYLETYKLQKYDEKSEETSKDNELYVKTSDFKALQQEINDIRAIITNSSENAKVG